METYVVSPRKLPKAAEFFYAKSIFKNNFYFLGQKLASKKFFGVKKVFGVKQFFVLKIVFSINYLFDK